MRDVTDNVTGELDVEVKRGRGRPRKEGALTNAQRQAAFRARRKASSSVTATGQRVVTRVLSEEEWPFPGDVRRPLPVVQVDAYDECRLEVEALRAELAEAQKLIAKLQRSHAAGLANENRLRRELEVAKAPAKSVTGRSNGIGLYAEIKKSSKYYGQTAPGELFAVRSLEKGEYAVQGGPGGQYRLRDVWLWSNGVRIG